MQQQAHVMNVCVRNMWKSEHDLPSNSTCCVCVHNKKSFCKANIQHAECVETSMIFIYICSSLWSLSIALFFIIFASSHKPCTIQAFCVTEKTLEIFSCCKLVSRKKHERQTGFWEFAKEGDGGFWASTLEGDESWLVWASHTRLFLICCPMWRNFRNYDNHGWWWWFLWWALPRCGQESACFSRGCRRLWTCSCRWAQWQALLCHISWRWHFIHAPPTCSVSNLFNPLRTTNGS